MKKVHSAHADQPGFALGAVGRDLKMTLTLRAKKITRNYYTGSVTIEKKFLANFLASF